MSKYKTLLEASQKGSLVDMATFVAESGDPNELIQTRPGHYLSTLHLFAHSGIVEGIELLIEIGADPNIKTSEGDTPLHSVIKSNKGSKEAVIVLLDKGANINSQSNDGSTPLHNALVMKKDEIATLLIDNGADENILNNRGVTPKQLSGYNLLKKMGL